MKSSGATVSVADINFAFVVFTGFVAEGAGILDIDVGTEEDDSRISVVTGDIQTRLI